MTIFKENRDLIFTATLIILFYGFWNRLQAIPVIQDDVKVLKAKEVDHDKTEAIISTKLNDLNGTVTDIKTLLEHSLSEDFDTSRKTFRRHQ